MTHCDPSNTTCSGILWFLLLFQFTRLLSPPAFFLIVAVCSPSAFYLRDFVFCMLLLCISAFPTFCCVPPSNKVGSVRGGDTGGAASRANVTVAVSAMAAADVHKVLIGIVWISFKWVLNSVRSRRAVRACEGIGPTFGFSPGLCVGRPARFLYLFLLLYWSGVSLLNYKVPSTFPSRLFAPVLLFLHCSADTILMYRAVL